MLSAHPVILSVSACGARTSTYAGFGPRAFAMGFAPLGVASLTTSEGTGATALGVDMGTKAERFWAKVDRRGPNECWPWTKSVFAKGYGQHMWAGTNTLASRVAWIITAGVTPPRHLIVCHTCNNPPCCNPAHLYLGTPKQNMADARRAGRNPQWTKTHCKRGHELNPENAPLRKLKGSWFRKCRLCTAILGKRYRENKKKRIAALLPPEAR